MPVARWHWLVAVPVALAAHAAVGFALLHPLSEDGDGASAGAPPTFSIALTLEAGTTVAGAAAQAAPPARNPSQPPATSPANPHARTVEPPPAAAPSIPALVAQPQPAAIAADAGPAIAAKASPLQTARRVDQSAPVPPPLPPRRAAQPANAPPQISAKSASALSGSGAPATGPVAPGPAALARSGYMTTLQAWLEQHMRYPERARARRQQGTATLYFVVNREGRVLDYRLEQSSGHRLLDREALALIARAAPLPQMPAGLRTSDLAVVVPIHFALR